MCDGAQNSRKGRATILLYSSIPDFDRLRTAMRFAVAMIAAMFAGSVFAKLPPPTDEAKAQAAEAAAYRKSINAAGKNVPVPVATAPCADAGPYVSSITPAASKPLEASGAHSPPGMALSPPSTKATAAEIAGGPKK